MSTGFSVDLPHIVNKKKYNGLKAILKTPEQSEIELLILTKAERDSLIGNNSVRKIDPAAFELWPSTKLAEVNGYVLDLLPSFSKNYFPAFSSMDEYLKFIRGKMHYNASYFLDQANALHVNYMMEESAIKKIIAENRYRIDSVNYPSKETQLHGGYKAYFLEDGSVGYFYNFYPVGNRYMGWWHPSIKDFEWFYNNVYELTDLKSS